MTATPQGFAVVTSASRLEERIAALPPLVSAKYRRLEEQRDTLHGGVLVAMERWQDAKRELTAAEAVATAAQDGDRRDVDRFNRQRQSGTPEPPSPRCAAALAARDRARDREASRRLAKEQSEAAWTAADRVLSAIQKLLRATSDPAELLPVLVERHGLRSPGDASIDLERVRAGIAGVSAELTALTAAPVTLPEAAPRLTAWLEDVFSQLNWPLVDFTRRGYRPPTIDEMTPYKAVTLLAGVPQVREIAHAGLKAIHATLPTSVSDADYPAAHARLVERRRQLELEEERIVLEAEVSGITIRRREGASPDVVLRVVLT